jgi:hypothetical protein
MNNYKIIRKLKRENIFLRKERKKSKKFKVSFKKIILEKNNYWISRFNQR